MVLAGGCVGGRTASGSGCLLYSCLKEQLIFTFWAGDVLALGLGRESTPEKQLPRAVRRGSIQTGQVVASVVPPAQEGLASSPSKSPSLRHPKWL